MHFTEVFLTSQVDPSSVANSRLASPDISNVLYRTQTFMPVFTAAQHRRYPHSSNTHTHTHTHTSTAFLRAVATPSPRLSRHAHVFYRARWLKKTGTWNVIAWKTSMELLVWKLLSGLPVSPRGPLRQTRGTQKRTGRGTKGKNPNPCLEFNSDHPVCI